MESIQFTKNFNCFNPSVAPFEHDALYAYQHIENNHVLPQLFVWSLLILFLATSKGFT